jgi:hypothetical protein
LKLTWQVTPRNKLQNFTQVNRSLNKNTRGGFEVDRDAQALNDRSDYFTGLIWESLLTDKLFFRTQIGFSQLWDRQAPEQCRKDPEWCDQITPIIQTTPRTIYLQNYDYHAQNVENRIQLVNTLEWFATTKRFGEHNIKIKDDLFTESFETAESTPGDAVVRYNGLIPASRTVFFANDPRFEDPRYGWFIRGTTGTRNALSINDSMRFSRYLTINPGLAWVLAKGTNSRGDVAINQQAFTPSVSVAWDPTHDGRTVLRGSFSSYADVDTTLLARHLLGGRVSRQDNWSAAENDYVAGSTYMGGASNVTIGLPCGPLGVDQYGRNCKEKLRIPRTWEYTMGAEREIVQGIALGADFVYRRFSHPYETEETNRIWNDAGTDLVEDGSFRNGRNETVSNLGTSDRTRRDYRAVTASVHRREGALKLNAGYTWSRLQGNVLDGTNNEWGENDGRDIFLYGPLSEDMRHALRVQAVYQMTSWLSTGVNWNYASGRPYSRRFRNDVLQSFSDYRAQVGTNPGRNLNDPGDDRPLRLPDIQRLNLQIRANLKPLTGILVEGYVDVLNIMALRTTTSVEQTDGPFFGNAGGRLQPLTVRIGARYKY